MAKKGHENGFEFVCQRIYLILFYAFSEIEIRFVSHRIAKKGESGRNSVINKLLLIFSNA